MLFHVVLVTQPSIISVHFIAAQRVLHCLAQHRLFPARGWRPSLARGRRNSERHSEFPATFPGGGKGAATRRNQDREQE